MSTQEELLKAISADEALMDELMQAWEKGADAQEIASLLASKDIEVSIDQAEALLALAQKGKANAIKTEDLDIDELNRMAGGGDGICQGTANCDGRFLHWPNTSYYSRCEFLRYCDQYYQNPH